MGKSNIKSITLAFALLLNGCFSHYSSVSNKFNPVIPPSTPNTIFFATESKTNCENKIREQVEQKTLQFIEENQFQTDISLANQVLSSASVSENYSFDEINGQIQEVKKTYYNFNGGVKIESSFTVGLNEKNSLNPMYFEIKSEQKSLAKKIELVQRYSVSENCSLNIKRTSLSQYTLNNGNLIHYESKTIADSEVTEDISKDFTVPAGKTSLDFSSMSTAQESIELLDQVSNGVSVIPAIGFIDFEMEKLTPFSESAFGTNFNFERRQITFLFNKKPLAQIIAQIDSANEAQLITYIGQNKKSWILPKKYKDQISLGQAQLGNSYFDSKLSAKYQSTSGSYILKTNKDFTFKNIKGYYKSVFVEEKETFKTYTMHELFPPVFDDNVTASDLEINSTIQSDLPEIQNIAQTILLKTLDRKGQISEILKYLSHNYTYDYDMVEKDKVRSLTTKEALDRKKGVCQHYAVLFTAIARALKIPSRIIVGYLINAEKPGMHAWVEAEVKQNQWQVIEPQLADGLTKTFPRFYFPLLRGFFLEDKNTNSTEFIMTMMDLKFEALPIQ